MKITHQPSNVIVYKTTDYKAFQFINGNRGLNDAKIKKIIAEIEQGNDMLQYYPIQVLETSDKLQVLDGQHRFFISRKLKRPVYYILVQENKSMADIAKVNSNVEKWKQQDFINCYINQGNKNYAKLQDFLEKYKINVGTSLRLLSNGSPGAEGTNDKLQAEFQHGTFVVKKLAEATAIAENIKKFQAFPFHTDRGFVIAIYRIAKAGLITIDALLDAYNKNPDKLTKCISQKQYIFNLEQLVNIGKQKRIVIT